MSILIS